MGRKRFGISMCTIFILREWYKILVFAPSAREFPPRLVLLRLYHTVFRVRVPFSRPKSGTARFYPICFLHVPFFAEYACFLAKSSNIRSTSQNLRTILILKSNTRIYAEKVPIFENLIKGDTAPKPCPLPASYAAVSSSTSQPRSTCCSHVLMNFSTSGVGAALPFPRTWATFRCVTSTV